MSSKIIRLFSVEDQKRASKSTVKSNSRHEYVRILEAGLLQRKTPLKERIFYLSSGILVGLMLAIILP